MLGVQGKYNLLSNVLLTAKAGINQYTNRADVAYFPASLLVNNPNNLDGVRTIDYVESTKYAEAMAETTIDSHRLVGGIYAGFLSVDQDDVVQHWGWDTGYYNRIYHPVGELSHLITVNNPKRINRALYVQDEIQLDEKSTLTVGARYDTYSDGRSALSPRIAFVHLYDDSNIFKAQYSRAFRPPSLSEQYSPNNPDSNKMYESETADTVELSYIFKTNDSSLKTTAFHSKTHNMISYHDFTYETINLENPTTINGLEIELTKNYEKINFGANMAFYKSHRGDVNHMLP